MMARSDSMSSSANPIPQIEEEPDTVKATVFSNERQVFSPKFDMPAELQFNTRLKMDGRQFLDLLPNNTITAAFFDPQYRGVLDKLNYGNEGRDRGKERSSLPQMSDDIIKSFIKKIANCLIASGHVFLWMDKFHLCTGFLDWIDGANLDVVDMITWDKQKMGMGYRTRRRGEHLIILQKEPRKAKGVWKIHNIPDVWDEEVRPKGHTHRKPVKLQGELIEAISNPGDVIIDPAAGSFSVLEACQNRNRSFLGCDING